MFRFSASFPRQALGAAVALAAISLSPGSAQAFVVTVSGQQYDVTTFTGTYNSNTIKFQTAANGGMMPWWGSPTLSQDFAAAVANSLGTPNYGGVYGPIFGYKYSSSFVNGKIYNNTTHAVNNAAPGPTETQTWAQATLYTPPAAAVPAPLPLFGTAAAFGFSRKLRKRIKLAAGSLGSALPRA